MAAVTAPVPAIPPSKTSFRRKPQIVYRSPSAEDGNYNQMPIIRPTKPALSTSSQSIPAPAHDSSVLLDPAKYPPITPSLTLRRRKHDMGPPLPLYHPFGKLAMSLDPLNTEELGLPALVQPTATSRKSVGRSRKTGQSSTDESDLVIMAEVAASAFVAPDTKAKEKVIPMRKKPVRGGNGKRKRKDTEDADPTYPAKRPRLPRGAAARESSAGNQPASPPPESLDDASATFEDPSEEKKTPKRKRRGGRSTRRRNSSVSDEETEGSVTGTQNNGDATSADQNAQSPSREGTAKPSPPQSSADTKESDANTPPNSTTEPQGVPES